MHFGAYKAKSHKNTETSKMDSSPIMFTSRKFPVSRVSNRAPPTTAHAHNYGSAHAAGVGARPRFSRPNRKEDAVRLGSLAGDREKKREEENMAYQPISQQQNYPTAPPQYGSTGNPQVHTAPLVF